MAVNYTEGQAGAGAGQSSGWHGGRTHFTLSLVQHR